MKLFEEHSSEYALRVGVNRSATSYYHYTNTHRHLATFLIIKWLEDWQIVTKTKIFRLKEELIS